MENFVSSNSNPKHPNLAFKKSSPYRDNSPWNLSKFDGDDANGGGGDVKDERVTPVYLISLLGSVSRYERSFPGYSAGRGFDPAGGAPGGRKSVPVSVEHICINPVSRGCPVLYCIQL
ncbi:hypothetical protein F511_27601 [Dorcoceras hygrometricum]|uniref:Uncharacterized protein n=1 Tax=Dorcoceras hygrometricum TaxID=472368 RepID=A0A2Z7APT2_9LAMI|nr:hypothetical protein F511_27601 [Dorcoceras hygrometricum]